jgi:hypothetical protein
MRALIAAGARVDSTANDGVTALHECFVSARYEWLGPGGQPSWQRQEDPAALLLRAACSAESAPLFAALLVVAASLSSLRLAPVAGPAAQPAAQRGLQAPDVQDACGGGGRRERNCALEAVHRWVLGSRTAGPPAACGPAGSAAQACGHAANSAHSVPNTPSPSPADWGAGRPTRCPDSPTRPSTCARSAALCHGVVPR